MVTKTASAAPYAMFGILAGVMAPILITIATFADPGWEFNVDTLSRLGISNVAFAANLFNYGCMAIGALIAILGIGKFRIQSDFDSVSGLFLTFAGIFMILVGVFTLDNYNTHVLVACLLLLTSLLAIIIGAISDWHNDRKITGAVGAVVIMITIAAFFGFNFAGWEVVSVFALFGWIIATSMSLAFSKA